MDHKDLGFELQRVTRQSLASLEQIDRFYLDFVVSHLYERMIAHAKTYFFIDDIELKKYVSTTMRHYMLVKKIKSHIIFLDQNTSSLPFDVPFDNCVLFIDIHPATDELYIQSLDRLAQACIDKNITLVILGCKEYDVPVIASCNKFDAFDCVFSEYELVEISRQLNIKQCQDLFMLTAGMPTLLRSWVIANEDSISYRHSGMYRSSLVKALSWFVESAGSVADMASRLQMLLIGESYCEDIYRFNDFDINAVKTPFTIINGKTVTCAGWEDISTYRTFFENHASLMYEYEGALLAALDFMHSRKNWKCLTRALRILPMNDIVAHYVAQIPFEAVNYSGSSLIAQAMSYQHALNPREVLGLRMAKAAIDGDVELLEAGRDEYVRKYEQDHRIVNQSGEIIRAFSLIGGKSVSLVSYGNSLDELTSTIKIHNDVLCHVYEGQLETAYEKVLLQYVEDDCSYIGQVLKLDLILLSFLLADDTWIIEDSAMPEVIERLSSSGFVSINHYMPVINDCIEAAFNNELSSFTLERAISIAQSKKHYLISCCLLTFSVLYNMKILNILKAYTQAQHLLTIAQNIDSVFIQEISYILVKLTGSILGEDDEDLPMDLKSLDNPESMLLSCMIDLLEGDISDSLSGSQKPAGVWWLLCILESINVDQVASLMKAMDPSWVHAYQHYKLRMCNLSNNVREVTKMHKENEKVLTERNKLQIKVMGTISIRNSGKEIREEDWTRKASKMLLLYLAIAENHTLSRADLQELLWPDKDYIAARGNFYTSLSTLKRTIGHNDELRPYIKSYEGYISLNPECVSVDLDIFISTARKMLGAQADPDLIMSLYEQLISTYDGGLFIPVGDESGRFQARHEYLKALYLETLMTFAEISLRMRRPRQAVRCAKEVLAIDDRREDAFILFIQALHSMGRRAEVVTAYSIFSKNLMNRYGIAITSATRDIYVDIIQDDSRSDLNFEAC